MIYTIEIRAQSMIVHSGVKLPKSRLHFQGAGIDIYVLGKVGKRREMLNYNACMIFRENNVPMLQMRDVLARR